MHSESIWCQQASNNYRSPEGQVRRFVFLVPHFVSSVFEIHVFTRWIKKRKWKNSLALRGKWETCVYSAPSSVYFKFHFFFIHSFIYATRWKQWFFLSVTHMKKMLEKKNLEKGALENNISHLPIRGSETNILSKANFSKIIRLHTNIVETEETGDTEVVN